MSDVDPDLPEWLTEAILDVGPPAEAVGLVKEAFTWRTIDAELMELSYDSVLDDAGVRDATARRTLEFTAGDVSLVVEIDGLTVRGSVVGEIEEVSLRDSRGELISVAIAGAQFSAQVIAGAASLVIRTMTGLYESPRFVIG